MNENLEPNRFIARLQLNSMCLTVVFTLSP